MKLIIKSLIALKEAEIYSQVSPKSMNTRNVRRFENDALAELTLLVNKGPRDFFVDMVTCDTYRVHQSKHGG